MNKASIGKSAGTEKGYFCRSLNNLKTMKKANWMVHTKMLLKMQKTF